MFNHLQHAIMVNQRLSLARSPNPKIISSPGWREHPNKNVRADEFSKQKLQGLVHFSLLEIDSLTEFSTCNRASEVLNDSVHLAFWKLQVEANGSKIPKHLYGMSCTSFFFVSWGQLIFQHSHTNMSTSQLSNPNICPVVPPHSHGCVFN